MSKKMYFLISFVLVLSLAGNVLAYDIMIWDNYFGEGDRLWTTSTNWYVDGSSPLERHAPGEDEWLCIDFMADDANGPIINRGMDVTGGEWLGLGDYYPPIDVNEPVILTMTGGTLTVGDWLSMGFYYEGIYRFDISGGTIDLQGTDGFTFGRGDLEEVGDGPYVTFNMSDGDFKCGAWLDIGAYNTAQADFNMTGGTLYVAQDLRIGAYEPNFVEWYGGVTVIKATGKGHLALHGGTITAAGDLAIGGGFGEGTMDIANDGTLILNGDYRQANGLLFDPCSDDPNNVGEHSGTIAILADRGIITAYNTQVGDIITDGNYPSVVGLRAVVNLDYDVPLPGWSTITARALDPNLAWDPDPLDGTGDINSPAVALTLSWLPGENAASHEVYFGTSQADVEDANTATTGIYRGSGSVVGPDGNDRYSYVIPGGDLPLVFGKSYYWRIDEVNGPTTWKGDVWSFDVEGKARIVYPTDGAVEIPFVNLTLLWEAGVDANSHDVYFGSDEAAVEDANTNTTGVFRGNQGLSDVNYALEDLDYLQSYYWRIDEVNTGTFAEGHVWSFTTAPARATNPSPEDGAREVSPLVVLSWDPGPEANDVKGHHVYLSSDLLDVLDRDPCVLTVRDTNNYTPGALELDARYYWAVDEVNNLEDPNVWPGKVWGFRTAEHLLVDNFELYVDTGTLNDTWHDWTWVQSSPGIGQYNAEVVYEPDTVHDGGKSMLYKYDNEGGAKFSEAWAYATDLGAGTDWTVAVGGVKALVLYFYGDEENTADPVYDRMWVGLEDGSGTFAKVNYDDMNDVDEPEWHPWYIKLQDFNDINNVDLTDVSKIYIGFGVKPAQGVAGTEGRVYFDDIQLWPPFCRPELLVADISGDCITDYKDVDIMARDWLISDYNVTPEAPDDVNFLVGWWKLDEGSGTIASDSAGSNDGTITDASWTIGYPNDPCNSGLDFDGDGDYVDMGNPDNLNFGSSIDFTFGAWIKAKTAQLTYPAIIGRRNPDPSNGYIFFLFSGGNLAVQLNDGSGTNYQSTSDDLRDDIWHHVAATGDRDGYLTFYVDGMQKGQNGISDKGNIDSTANLFIGWEERNPTATYFNGLIDDVRIYDKCLTTGEIAYLAGSGPMYVPVLSPANLVPKVPPGGPFNPNNLDIVNFRDYAILADHWLEGPTLWP